MATDQLNSGIIGLGKWGKILLEQFSTLASVNKYYSIKPKGFTEIEYADDTEEIFNDQAIDIVIISSPINTHFEYTKRALEKGKHVFTEKPLCLDSGKIKNILELAKRNNLNCHIDYQFTFHPIYKKLVSLSEEIKSLSLSWNKYGSFEEDVLKNLLTHELSISTGIMGDISYIKKSGENTKNKVNLTLHHKTEKVSHISINRESAYKEKVIKVEMEDGKQMMWREDELIDTDNQKILLSAPKTALINSIEHFIEEIKLNKFSYKTLQVEEQITNALSFLP